MPLLKLKHIVSFSSEDLKHPAENILKPESYFKWKCATAGERQVSVVVQLEKSTKIHSIDIGNNGSAFVEVLVGRSSWGPSEEHKVLLVASSFMSPVESKNNKELYRVRMFGVETFTKAVSEEKWDLLKLVCTQPYNQNETYGLSFVNVHSPPVPVVEENEKTIQLGRFKLRSNSDSDDDTITTGSFFRQKESLPTTETPGKTMAAACRDASKLHQLNASSKASPMLSKVVKTIAESTPAKIGISTECRDKVASNLIQSPSPSISGSAFPRMKTTLKPSAETIKRKIESSPSVKNQDPPAKKTKVEEKKPLTKKKKMKKKNAPTHKILENVVFCLSGFENPERGQIRDEAQSMGAQYSPGWNNQCTHLICAFRNTPKYRQVKGYGKIVKKEWIKECRKTKRRANTKSFRMDGGGDSSYESTDSESENEAQEKRDEKSYGSTKETQKSASSECDTEDELEKLQNLNKTSDKEAKDDETRCCADKVTTQTSAYDCSTDDGEDIGMKAEKTTESISKPELPNFFEDKHFLIYGSIDTRDRRLLQRYITAYGGTLLDYMGPQANYVISNEDWDENFDEACKENNALTFLRPSWIHKCHEKQRLVDHSTHTLYDNNLP